MNMSIYACKLIDTFVNCTSMIPAWTSMRIIHTLRVGKSTPKNAHESILFDTIRLRASPWILIRIIGTLKVCMMRIDVHAGIMDVQFTNVSINLHA